MARMNAATMDTGAGEFQAPPRSTNRETNKAPVSMSKNGVNINLDKDQKNTLEMTLIMAVVLALFLALFTRVLRFFTIQKASSFTFWTGLTGLIGGGSLIIYGKGNKYMQGAGSALLLSTSILGLNRMFKDDESKKTMLSDYIDMRPGEGTLTDTANKS